VSDIEGFTGAPVLTPGIPTFSSRAVVCWKGAELSESAIQNRAFAGAITRPRLSTTRNEILTFPGE
jgi:hypothetical protein